MKGEGDDVLTPPASEARKRHGCCVAVQLLLKRYYTCSRQVLNAAPRSRENQDATIRVRVAIEAVVATNVVI